MLTVQADGDDLIDRIRKSLRLLPDGYTTVPYDPDDPRHTRALLRVGFDLRVVEKHRPGLSAGVILDSDPAFGSVVREGSTVTLVVSSGDAPVN